MMIKKLPLTFAILASLVYVQPAFSATCTCKITLVAHDFSNPDDFRELVISSIPAALRSAELEVNIMSWENCKAKCRDEFGADGTVSSRAGQVKKKLRAQAEKHGKPFNWCGGWLDARLDSKKGVLPIQESITGGPISTGARTCPSVPPGLAKNCCSGPNALNARSGWPIQNWALLQTGHFARVWWDQKELVEAIEYPYFNDPIVSGSLEQDPFGDGLVALTERGNVVRTVRRNDGVWQIELVKKNRLRELGGVKPCRMITTENGKFKGIWVVAGNFILRFYREDKKWKENSVDIGDNAPSIVPSSLHELDNGQIGGVLGTGRRWGIWFLDADPNKMRYDWGLTDNAALPPSASCVTQPNHK